MEFWFDFIPGDRVGEGCVCGVCGVGGSRGDGGGGG